MKGKFGELSIVPLGVGFECKVRRENPRVTREGFSKAPDWSL